MNEEKSLRIDFKFLLTSIVLFMCTIFTSTAQSVTNDGGTNFNSFRINVDRTGSGAALILAGDGYADDFELANDYFDERFHITNGFFDGTNSLFSVEKTGNVGIGIGNPSEKLSVNGNISTNDYMIIDNENGNRANGGLKFTYKGNTTETPMFFNRESSNIFRIGVNTVAGNGMVSHQADAPIDYAKNGINMKFEADGGHGRVMWSLNIRDKDDPNAIGQGNAMLTAGVTGTMIGESLAIGYFRSWEAHKERFSVRLRDPNKTVFHGSGPKVIEVSLQKQEFNIYGSLNVTNGENTTINPIAGTVAHFDGRVYISEDNGTEARGGSNAFDTNDDNYKDYLLYVEEGIVSSDFAIAETSDWPDYVFSADYG